MANETVKQICDEIRGTCDMYDLSFSVSDGNGLSGRIEEAHEREIEERDALIKQMAKWFDEHTTCDRNCKLCAERASIPLEVYGCSHRTKLRFIAKAQEVVNG